MFSHMQTSTETVGSEVSQIKTFAHLHTFAKNLPSFAWAFCLDDSHTLQNITQDVRSDILPVLPSPWPAARQEIRETR